MTLIQATSRDELNLIQFSKDYSMTPCKVVVVLFICLFVLFRMTSMWLGYMILKGPYVEDFVFRVAVLGSGNL